jgi:hypothetical protein
MSGNLWLDAMARMHLCDACYTDLEHHKLMRICPQTGPWYIAWAEGLAARTASQAVLKDFFMSTFLSSFIDISHGTHYRRAIAILLRHPEHGPMFEGLLVEQIVARYQHDYYSYWMKPIVNMLLEEPRVRAWASAMPGMQEHWLHVRPDAPIIAETWKAVRCCGRIKGELIERTWHPDRVWNWCFDEEEKREIGAA